MTVHTVPRPKLLCPSCGEFVRYLNEKTGFCRKCTHENERGGPVNPHDNLKR